MAQQEDGWPLGLLQQLNRRVSLATSFDLSGSVSSSSLSSSSSSSGFDSKETLGSTANLFRRSSPSSMRSNYTDGFGTLSPQAPQQQPNHGIKKNQTIKKHKSWLCSLCSKPVSDDEDHNRSNVMRMVAPVISLGYLLEEERRAIARINRNQTAMLLLSTEIHLVAKE